MKLPWTFYSVATGGGHDRDRVGMAILVSAQEIKAKFGTDCSFDKKRETALLDMDGLFLVADIHLSAIKAPPYTFFVKTAIGTSWFCPDLKDRQFKTASYAINSFGFLLPVNKMLTPEEFAQRIADHYSLDNPRTLAVVDCLKSL